MPFALDNAKYLPTYITVAEIKDLSEKINTVWDLRKRTLKNRLLRLQEYSVEPKRDVTAIFKPDVTTMERSATISLDHTARFDLYVWESLSLGLYNWTEAKIDNFAYRYGYWILKPTITDKIFFGKELSEDEKALAEKYSLTKQIEVGALPLPLNDFIEKTFKRKRLETVAWNGDIKAEKGANIGARYSSTGHYLLLESIAADKPPDASYTTAIKLTVDGEDFHELRAWAMSGSTVDVPFFIPAVDSFSLSVETNKDVDNYNLRYTFSEVSSTNFLKMMFGIIPPERNPEVANRIRAGIPLSLRSNEK